MPTLKTSIKHISTKNGLILGVLIGLITLVAYLVNWDIFLSPWFQIGKFFLVIAFGVAATIMAKRYNPEKFSFRDAFSAYFITVLIGLLLYFVINTILFAIDDQPGAYLTQMSVDQLEHLKTQMSEAGKKTDKISQQIKDLQNTNQFSFLNQLQGFIMNLVLYCVPGVIIALIFKTKKPIVV